MTNKPTPKPTNTPANKAIFHDPSGKRATRMAWITWISLGTIGVVFSIFLTHLIIAAPMPELTFKSPHHGLPPASAHASNRQWVKSSGKLADELRVHERRVAWDAHVSGERRVDRKNTTAATLQAPGGRPLAMGFYVNWDDNSYASLKQHIGQLDAVIPSWLMLTGPQMDVTSTVDTKALNLITTMRPDIPVLPMIQNSSNGVWDGKGLAQMLANPALRKQRLDQVVAFLAENKMHGLTIDFENVPEAAQPDLKAFLTEMSAAFAPRGWTIVLCVPFNNPEWDYAAYGEIVDYTLLMAYDEHWEEGPPGSIAGQEWFEKILDKRMSELDPDYTLVAIGNYGYDWTEGKVAADDITFQEAVREAQSSGSDIGFDPDSENPMFDYTGDDGKPHHVWFLDGVTAYNQMHAADNYKPAGYALWRMGSEDPTFWDVAGKPYGTPAPESMKTIAASSDVEFNGVGEILHIISGPATGTRAFERDPETQDVVDENYTAIPSPYIIQRLGDVPGKIALTFDDGPDAKWTPKILDILKAKGVHATFFIVGENAGAQPELVRRLVAEGHDVGNHSFTHPNMAVLPTALTKMEINATELLFEGLTGRTMRLFRAPYFGDAEPTTMDEIVPIQIAQSMGLLSVGLHIDPDDWQRPPADEIVSRVMEQVASTNPDIHGQVVLLHDAGGDRANTVAALPVLIDRLRAAGYQLVLVSELAGLTRDQAMPPAPADARGSALNWTVFSTLSTVSALLGRLFLVAIWLGVLRLFFLSSLALLHWHQETRKRTSGKGKTPLVSVLIPAKNEAQVIGASIARILASDYENLQVIVIDDGSTDATVETVNKAFGRDKRVQVLSTGGVGKAEALNLGLQHIKGEVIVALDADTQFEKDAISYLAAWFDDPKIAAVAGNAKVGNRINTITRCQALEYISAQNIERRALASLDCITVVPGAVGAWRASVLHELGGFPPETLAEDQDLTITVQKAGYRVVYESRAIAWTEAPDSLRGLARQRFRWTYGTLQCLWKHRGMLFRRRYGALGMVGLPQVWLFQIILALLAPLVDLALVVQIIRTGVDYWQHQNQYDPTNLLITLLYFGVFMGVDLAAISLAFVIERKENWSLMIWMVVQRFGYRQILYYVVMKSFIASLAGHLVGWGRMNRKATVVMK